MEKQSKSVSLHLPVIIAVLVGWFIGSLYFGLDRGGDYAAVVQRGLGIELSMSDDHAVFTPDSGGLADSAGLKAGDVMSFYPSLSSFYDDVYRHSGMPFAFQVERGGNAVVILIPYLPKF